ncbi:MAG: ornithine carbamoyltransferase [Thermodesulfobacteriota bacterium]
MTKHFLRILDLDRASAHGLLARAVEMKRARFRGECMAGKSAIMLFEKASTRTRVSFEVAVRDLAGSVIFMTTRESQLGRSEPLCDTARVLSRYVDCMIVRTFGQTKLDELAYYSDIPVVNALSDDHHPCQVMSDVLTMAEVRPDLENVRVAWVGDGNNMAQSLMEAAALFPFELRLATPEGYDPDPNLVAVCREAGARLLLTRDPEEAVDGAHFVHTDVWASMGQEGEAVDRARIFAAYQVNDDLMAAADRGARFMHCLPAHRGEEVSQEVMDGPRSIVWDQAENRLHMQKAILEWLFT